MMGYIWLFFILSSIVIGAMSGKIDLVTQSIVISAKSAVDIAIGLIGIMTFWLGFLKIAEKSGVVTIIAKAIKPITKRLFPEIPPEHPAIGNIAMNFTANALGLGNAATPIGIKAMEELQELNTKKDTATNPMCTFLAMNTAGFQLVPATVIGILAASGCKNPTHIIGPTIIATSISLTIALIAVKTLEKLFPIKVEEETTND